MMDPWTWRKDTWSTSIWTLLKVAISRVPAWSDYHPVQKLLSLCLVFHYPLHSNFLYHLSIMEDTLGSLFLYWLWHKTTGRGNPLLLKSLFKENNFPNSELAKEVKQVSHGTALVLKTRRTLKKRRKCPLPSTDADSVMPLISCQDLHWCSIPSWEPVLTDASWL